MIRYLLVLPAALLLAQPPYPDKTKVLEYRDDSGTAHPVKTPADWAKRPKIGDVNYNRDGVPWEILIGLCNTLHANVWVCVPAHATDDYVTQLATLLKNSLSPSVGAMEAACS